jgi:hypothetical protein
MAVGRRWQRKFEEPVKETAASERQGAIEALTLVVERGGPTMLARISVMRALNRGTFASSPLHGKDPGAPEAKERPMTVWIYVDTSRLIGDVGHLRVFTSEDAAEKWLKENDPEGVAFEYPVLGE